MTSSKNWPAWKRGDYSGLPETQRARGLVCSIESTYALRHRLALQADRAIECAVHSVSPPAFVAAVRNELEARTQEFMADPSESRAIEVASLALRLAEVYRLRVT